MGPEPDAEGAPVWRALADPIRRGILDLLRDRPRTTGGIAAQFPVSRIAVMRHLQVLAGAGLVTSRKRGRERWHYLNAIPLQRIHERWVDPAAQGWATGLLRLRRQVEGGVGLVNAGRPALDIALDISIAASPAKVFAALTEDPGGWWGHPYLRAHATGLTLERRLGGLLLETWDGGGAVLATVTGWTGDRFLELSGPFHLGVAIGVAAFQLDAGQAGTSLQFTFGAIGAIEPEVLERFAEGWSELVSRRLKTLVETGARLGVEANPPK